MKQKNTYWRKLLGFVVIPVLLNPASYAEEDNSKGKRNFGDAVSLRCWGFVSKDKKLATKGDRGRFRLDLDFKY